MDILEKLTRVGVIPVISIEDAAKAAPLAEALCGAGLPCAEVTFRTDAAGEAIRNMRKACPSLLIGAGTVLTPSQADEAMRAGADFIVSPGYNPHTVDYCLSMGYPMIPGVNNASGIEQALEAGLTAVKFFPAEASGGVQMIKALSAPYSMMKFMPTGGISAANLKEYLSLPSVFCCGGSWMVTKALLEKGDFRAIEELAGQAVRLAGEARK